jgi:hypothetical protein
MNSSNHCVSSDQVPVLYWLLHFLLMQHHLPCHSLLYTAHVNVPFSFKPLVRTNRIARIWKLRLLNFNWGWVSANGFGLAVCLDVFILRTVAAGGRNSYWQLGLWEESCRRMDVRGLNPERQQWSHWLIGNAMWWGGEPAMRSLLLYPVICFLRKTLEYLITISGTHCSVNLPTLLLVASTGLLPFGHFQLLLLKSLQPPLGLNKHQHWNSAVSKDSGV